MKTTDGKKYSHRTDRDKFRFVIHIVREKLLCGWQGLGSWKKCGLRTKHWVFSIETNKDGYSMNYTPPGFYFHQIFLFGFGVAYKQKDRTKYLPTL